jgi:hypothetical protein
MRGSMTATTPTDNGAVGSCSVDCNFESAGRSGYGSSLISPPQLDRPAQVQANHHGRNLGPGNHADFGGK